MVSFLYPPTIKKLHYSGAPAGNGNNTIIAAPGPNLEMVIAHWYLQNTTAVATTAKLMAGSFTFFQRLFPTLGDGFGVIYPPGLEERLGLANALILNLSGANAFNVVIGYWLDNKQ